MANRVLALAVCTLVGVFATDEVAAQEASNGLVAAYSFDEGAGTTVTDISGNGNTGVISGATWTTEGRFGGALSFDGVNDWVTVNDAASLMLTTGMTLEAWVYPTESPTGWRTVVAKEGMDTVGNLGIDDITYRTAP